MAKFIVLPVLGLLALSIAPSGATAAPLTASVQSSAPSPPAGPEYVGVFEARVGGQPRALERQKVEVKFKIKMMGYGGSRSGIEVPGARSPVRFAAGQPLEFILRVASQETDPQSVVTLYHMTQKKDRRFLQNMRTSFLGGGTTTTNRQVIPFDARRYGTQFFRITAVGTLPPGEYMLMSIGGVDAFLFGIN